MYDGGPELTGANLFPTDDEENDVKGRLIDLAQIMALIGQGVVGHLVEMTSADGDRICIYVE